MTVALYSVERKGGGADNVRWRVSCVDDDAAESSVGTSTTDWRVRGAKSLRKGCDGNSRANGFVGYDGDEVRALDFGCGAFEEENGRREEINDDNGGSAKDSSSCDLSSDDNLEGIMSSRPLQDNNNRYIRRTRYF